MNVFDNVMEEVGKAAAVFYAYGFMCLMVF